MSHVEEETFVSGAQLLVTMTTYVCRESCVVCHENNRYFPRNPHYLTRQKLIFATRAVLSVVTIDVYRDTLNFFATDRTTRHILACKLHNLIKVITSLIAQNSDWFLLRYQPVALSITIYSYVPCETTNAVSRYSGLRLLAVLLLL